MNTNELFTLENFYWNDFQTANPNQVGPFYQHVPETAAQYDAGVYYDVIRLLGDGKPS